MNKKYERMMEFTTEELIELLEIEPEEIIERFGERINETQTPWIFNDGFE